MYRCIYEYTTYNWNIFKRTKDSMINIIIIVNVNVCVNAEKKLRYKRLEKISWLDLLSYFFYSCIK